MGAVSGTIGGDRFQSPANGLLRKVAIDLTPMLPGGANGGAKVFILHLIGDLARLAPSCEFLLLTHEGTYAELADLERANVKRLLIPGPEASKTSPSWRSVARTVVRHLPQRSKALLARGHAHFVNQVPRRLVNELDHQLLFCPFTAPTYHSSAVPTVCTIYDLQFKEYPQFFSTGDLRYRSVAFADAVRDASALAAISEYSRQSALGHGKIAPERIVAIALRLAERLEIVSAEQCRPVLAGFGLDYGCYLFYPANFWLHKNHEVLLESFVIARGLGLATDTKLVLTGNSDARQQTIRAMVKSLGLETNVVIPGFLGTEQFRVLLNGCTGVVFPSLFEGFGLPIVEAMAVGKPVACSRVTSLPEVAGDAALLFDPRAPSQIAAAMVSLNSDHVLRERLIAAGFERARKFQDSMQMAREYWTLFESALMTHR